MAINDDLIEINGHQRYADKPEYNQKDAEMLVGRIVKSEVELGVYGRVTGVQGFVDGNKTEKQKSAENREAVGNKPYFGVKVDWAQKPAAELSQQSVLFRSDVDKHYPLVYGNELKQAEQVCNVHQKQQSMKQEMGQSISQSVSRGRR